MQTATVDAIVEVPFELLFCAAFKANYVLDKSLQYNCDDKIKLQCLMSLFLESGKLILQL
eukprot:6484218-Amphidinium_carterae.1